MALALRRKAVRTWGRGPSSLLRSALAATAVCGALLLTSSGAARAERRLALVIGNSTYVHAPMLRNPAQDAGKISNLLRQLDFDVTTVTDADKIGMEAAIRRFTASLQDADVALFYYSGHALQVADRNYLVPISAAISGPRNLNLDAFALQDISAAMRHGGAKIELLFLDACRDNPFGEALSPQGYSPVRGLAPIELPTGSLVAYSASPGQVALDGTGDLSPFTAAFAHYGAEPKMEIRQVLSRVTAEVSQVTDNRQIPKDESSLPRDFYLVPGKAPPVFEHAVQATVPGGAQPQPLRLKAPIQPEGGNLQIKIVKAPAIGTLAVGGRPIGANETITPADFAALTYAGSGSLDLFTFRIDDAWGNSDLGAVSIARQTTASPDVTTTPPVVSAPASLDAHAVSLLGLGPNLIFKAPLPLGTTDAGERIELAATPPFGQILLGDRVIEQGRTLDASQIRQIAFVPPPGSAGQHVNAVFKTVERPAREIRIGIDIEMTDCDRLAGDRLDPQGVGEGVLTGQIDTAAALAACETAVKARPNAARFVYQLGRVFAALGRNDDALASFRKAADAGHTRALWALGNHFEYAQPPNFVEGKAQLEKAAAAGDVYATHSLGLVYYEGRGVPKDLDKARGLFEAAARVGHTFSMNSLGGMYQRGEGEPVDPAMARRYFEESAKRGDMYGIDNLGFAYLDGVGVDKDAARALGYFKQASDLGHPEAPNNIGRMYVLGLGVPVDFAEARRWDLIGADRGDGWAAFNLGELYREGKGGAADPVQAGYFYARAAASTNQLEPSTLARQQLARLERGAKLGALRRLMADIDPKSAAPANERALLLAAQAAAARKRIAVADRSIEALAVAVAQVVWNERNARADLF